MKRIIVFKSVAKDTGEYNEIKTKPLDLSVPEDFERLKSLFASFVKSRLNGDFMFDIESYKVLTYSERNVF